MAEEVIVSKDVWDALTLLGGSEPRLSAKGFERRSHALKVPLTYLLSASHSTPTILGKSSRLSAIVETLTRQLHRQIVLVYFGKDGKIKLVQGQVVEDNGSRLSLVVLLQDHKGQWRWVMWETKATLSLPDLLKASCGGSATPLVESIQSSLFLSRAKLTPIK
jgi:hypothetical protein